MTTKLAIPLFHDCIAPRFCFADEMLVVTLEGGQVASSHQVSFAQVAWPDKLAHLAAMGVSVLLCGGFNRQFMPLAESLEIHVIWGLAGTAVQVADAYCDGTVDRFCLLQPDRQGDRCFRTKTRRRAGRSGGKQQGHR